jgi:hypothetical protein
MNFYDSRKAVAGSQLSVISSQYSRVLPLLRTENFIG